MSFEAYTVTVAAIVGAVMGSFMNVLIYRLPRDMSVIGGRSKCPSCQATVGARDNVPVLSWLWLRGRCRRCSWRIPVRYPLVESISATAAPGAAIVPA